MPNSAIVEFNGRPVGLLYRISGKYFFEYSEEYLGSKEPRPIAYTLPLRKEAFVSVALFPFFEGLVTEGWLLNIQSTSQKIDERDAFSLLLENGEDLIGAVSLKSID